MWGDALDFLRSPGVPIAVAVSILVLAVRKMRSTLLYCSRCLGAKDMALSNLKGLRLDKMDKKSVFVVGLQKSGSTLLCYLAALINTKNSIQEFRNDFDLLPMLSFSSRLINQNFNARQDGIYQMYKINGSIRFLEGPLDRVGANRIVWNCREFRGYYRSVYWWIRSFYPRVSPGHCWFFRFIGWDLFKRLTLRRVAEDHVNDLRCGYNRLVSSDKGFFFLAYEQVVEEKTAAIRGLADWLGIGLSEADVRSISDKTSKSEMAKEPRFDPVNYGEGAGLSKVNVEPHADDLNDSDQKIYDSIFDAKFADTGIQSYRQLIATMMDHQDSVRDCSRVS